MDVFLIETPLQLLNAIEARRAFPADRAVLWIVLSRYHDREAFAPLVTESDWEEVLYLPPVSTLAERERKLVRKGVPRPFARAAAGWKQIGQRRRFDRLARGVGRVERLFLGNQTSSYHHMRHLANQARYEELVQLDDGTDTLLIHKARTALDPRAAAPEEPSAPSRLRRWILDRWLHWNESRPPRVTFFSAYDLEVSPSDRLVRNRYEVLRAKVSAAPASEGVFFLGQPLVDSHYMTLPAYLAALERVRDHFGDEPVLYVPHRREDDEKLGEIERRLGFGVRRFPLPIEVEMAVNGRRPRVLAAFLCSALETCRQIFGETLRIKAFRLERDEFVRGQDDFESIYQEFEAKASRTFEVIPRRPAAPRDGGESSGAPREEPRLEPAGS